MNYQKNGLKNIFQWGILIFPFFPLLGGIIFGIILIYLWIKEFNYLKQLTITKLFALLTLGLIIVSIFAEKPGESFLGLANFLPFFAFFIAFTRLFPDINSLRQFALCLVIPFPLISIIGLGQLYLNWQTPPLFLGWELIANGNPEGRMSSIFMYANILAIYLLICLTFSLGLWIDFFANKVANTFFLGKNLDSKIVFIYLSFSIIINSIALILTNSRNAWGIAFLVFIIYSIYGNWYYLLSGIMGLISLILGASFAPISINKYFRLIVPKYFWARLSDEQFSDRPLELTRINQWQFSWDLMQKRPLTGWGLRNFSHLYQEKYNLWLGHPHNFFLMLGGETGIIITLFFSSIIGYILGKSILFLKSIKNSDKLIILTYLISFNNIILFNLFDVTIFDFRINTLSWLILAAIYGVQLNKKESIL